MAKGSNRAYRGRKTYSTVSQVAARYQKSRSTIWRWANEERFAELHFPKPILMGPNSELWDDDELDEYDARRAAMRDVEPVPEPAAA